MNKTKTDWFVLFLLIILALISAFVVKVSVYADNTYAICEVKCQTQQVKKERLELLYKAYPNAVNCVVKGDIISGIKGWCE